MCVWFDVSYILNHYISTHFCIGTTWMETNSFLNQFSTIFKSREFKV